MDSEIRRLRERLAANGVAHSPSYTQSPLHKRGRRSDSPLCSQVGQTGFVLSAPPPSSSLTNQLPHGAGNGGATDAPHVEETVVDVDGEPAGDEQESHDVEERVLGSNSLNQEFSLGGISDDSIESFSSDDRKGGPASRRHVWLSEDSEEDMAVGRASGTSSETAGRSTSDMVGKGTPYPPTTTGTTSTTSGTTTDQAVPKAQRRTNGSSKRRVWEDEAIDEWLEDGKSTETVRKYRGHIDDLFEFLSTSSTLWYKHVTYLQLLGWRKHVIAHASVSTKQPRVAAVKSLFKALVQRRHIQENPAQHLKMPSKPPPSKVVRYLTKEQVTLFGDACRGLEMGLFAGCYYGMLRKKEVRKLRLKDCTFVQKEGQPELLRLHVIGKGRDEKERDVTLGVKGTELLRPFVVACTADDHYLFTGNQGPLTPLSSRQTGRRIKTVFKRIGIKKGSSHYLRHAGASHAFHNGASMEAIRDILGHTSLEVTSRYLHTADDTVATRALDGVEAVVAISDILGHDDVNVTSLYLHTADDIKVTGKTSTMDTIRKELEQVEAMFRDGLIDEQYKNKLRQKVFDENQ